MVVAVAVVEVVAVLVVPTVLSAVLLALAVALLLLLLLTLLLLRRRRQQQQPRFSPAVGFASAPWRWREGSSRSAPRARRSSTSHALLRGAMAAST